MDIEQRIMQECIGVWDAMLQACYVHLLRWTCDERGGFTKGRPRQGPVGASEITQTEILRSHNETREFREGHHAGHHARKTSARWSKETVDRWYRSMGREKPGRNGKTGEKQKRFPVLSSWSRLHTLIHWARQADVAKVLRWGSDDFKEGAAAIPLYWPDAHFFKKSKKNARRMHYFA